MFNRYKIQNLHLSVYNPKDVGRHDGNKVHAYGPATRRYWLIHYIFDGEVTFSKGEKVYTVHKGQCFIIRPDEITYYKTSENWHYAWIGFTGGTVPSCLKTDDVLDASFLEELFAELTQNVDYYNGTNGENGVREAYLSGKIGEAMALLEIFFDRPKEPESVTTMKKVKNYIDIRLSSDICVQNIADEFHMDRTHLSRQFKTVFGMSPQNYIVSTRLHEAARLMREHGVSPTDAANAVGYADIYLFSKMFKRRLGVSPRQYTKKEP